MTEHTASQIKVNLRLCHCGAGPNCSQVTPKVTLHSQRQGPFTRRPCTWAGNAPEKGLRTTRAPPCLLGSRSSPPCLPQSRRLGIAGAFRLQSSPSSEGVGGLQACTAQVRCADIRKVDTVSLVRAWARGALWRTLRKALPRGSSHVPMTPPPTPEVHPAQFCTGPRDACRCLLQHL